MIDNDLQARVGGWMRECFPPAVLEDRIERADRFIEEALELAQATGWTADRGHALVDYVFDRPAGEPGQEVGGVMVTLAALCNTHGIDIEREANREIVRITAPVVMEKIRAKQASKPTGSALPTAVARGEPIDQATIDAGITAEFENDLQDMTDEQIAKAIREAQGVIDEHEPWLEALCVRQRQRATAKGDAS